MNIGELHIAVLPPPPLVSHTDAQGWAVGSDRGHVPAMCVLWWGLQGKESRCVSDN